jgi:demethylmenaquinone methyltransferase/2-methoxy-6-polyprenyl-1,4-benzoquinol methylase
MTTVVPYKDDTHSKKEQVATMFNNISPKYDFLNHFLSLGIDIIWRKIAIKKLKPYQPKYILDVATGTGDFAIAALKLNPTKIIGVDISDGMLDMGRIKLIKKKYDDKISLLNGDSENLHFDENTFDAVTVAFGVRNFENLEKGLLNIKRVLKPNSPLLILEFSKPKIFPVKQIYNFYFKFTLPLLGRLFSRDRSAYTYLPESVSAFPEGKDFIQILEKLGFKKCKNIPLTFGISSIYIAEK